MFDHNGCIKRYSSAEEILREFYDYRMDFYRKRKDYLEGMLAAESLKMDNIARFIMEKIEGTVTVGKTIGFERIIVNNFLPLSFNKCFRFPKELSH